MLCLKDNRTIRGRMTSIHSLVRPFGKGLKPNFQFRADQISTKILEFRMGKVGKVILHEDCLWTARGRVKNALPNL